MLFDGLRLRPALFGLGLYPTATCECGAGIYLDFPGGWLCDRTAFLSSVSLSSLSMTAVEEATPSPPPVAQPPSLGSTVDALANSAMQQQGLPGMTIALGKNGTMLYVKAYGISNMATHLTTQTNTIFEIGSITKQFTAALIMKLQEQGKLQVDDPIDAYLPEYNFPSAITLRRLLPTPQD